MSKATRGGDTDHKPERARQRAGSWAVRSRVRLRGQTGKREMRPQDSHGGSQQERPQKSQRAQI